MRSMATIKLGTRGERVRVLQRAVNERLRSRRPSARIAVDGVWGPKSKEACRIAGHLMGVLNAGKHPGRCQEVVLDHTKRTTHELERATKRMKAERAANSGPAGAVAFAGRYIGKTEHPPGSNKAPWGLTSWQRELAGGGDWLIGEAWCGTFVWACLTKGGGVRGLTARTASVWFILEDALAGRNGWQRCVYRRKTGHGSLTAGRAGDAVGLYGEGTHVALIVKRVAGGYITREGNTSRDVWGSQSNGGGCFERFRPDSAVVYIARPRF